MTPPTSTGTFPTPTGRFDIGAAVPRVVVDARGSRPATTSRTEYLAQMRKTIARLGTLDEATLSRDARERLLLAFRGWWTG